MKKSRKKIKYLLLIILLLTVSIGYAYINSTLNITGVGTINNPTWDIHFDNVQVKTGSVSTSNPATIDNPKTTVNYSVEFTIPGQYYEFTVDVVNAGTIDGMVSVVSNKLNGTEITTLPNYLEYIVKYEDDIDIQPNQLLEAGHSEKIKVHVGYKKNINNSDIPEGIQTLNFSFSVTYVQRNESAQSIQHGVTVYTIAMDMNLVEVGNEIPSTIHAYNSPEEFLGPNDSPIYLKHVLKNNIVQETYVEFIITEAMAQANSGLTPGTYALQGGGATYLGDGHSNNDSDWRNDSQYYMGNIAILEHAFGENNCNIHYSCNEGNNCYKTECGVPGFTVITYNSGKNTAEDENNYFGCATYRNSSSECYVFF